MNTSALSLFKKLHGVATHRVTGAGNRYPWMAFFATVTLKDGTRRAFTELAHEYSMLELMRRDKIADADTELEACKLLAERNKLPWPADEPKKRKSKPKKRDIPPPKIKVCYNCKHWHKKDYKHCQHSGPWGGNIIGDANCTFDPKKRKSKP